MPQDESPLSAVGNGHQRDGRFAKGNKQARGNPLNRRAQKIRSAILRASTADDIKEIARSLIDGAKAGDLAFIKEFLDRTAGRPGQAELMERVEALEAALTEQQRREGTNGHRRSH